MTKVIGTISILLIGMLMGALIFIACLERGMFARDDVLVELPYQGFTTYDGLDVDKALATGGLVRD